MENYSNTTMDEEILRNILNAFGNSYDAVYLISMETGKLAACTEKTGQATDVPFLSDGGDYGEEITEFIESQVFYSDRAALAENTELNEVERVLSQRADAEYRFRLVDSEKIASSVKYIRVGTKENSNSILLLFSKVAPISADEIVKMDSVKKTLLIIENNIISRSVLRDIIGDSYNIIEAKDGAEGYETLKENMRLISLVLLDYYSPKVGGEKFMKRLKADYDLASIPVAFTAFVSDIADNDEDYDIGEADYILKPYDPMLVVDKIKFIIDKQNEGGLSVYNEYDKMTGMYTERSFFAHAQIMLKEKKATQSLHMMAVDMANLRTITRARGDMKADEVVEYTGRKLAEQVPYSIGYRKGEYFFLLVADGSYILDGKNWEALATDIAEHAPVSRLVLKMGLYMDVSRNMSIQLMIERAKIAVDSIREDIMRDYALFDQKMLSRHLDDRELEAAFHQAIADNNFKVYFQPKYDVQTEEISAAEALVRWQYTEDRMLMPGTFIPLFERDGLIRDLDEYIFVKVCEFQKKRILYGQKVVPISINLSRASLSHSETIEKYSRIVKDLTVKKDLVPIELTESADIDESEVERLAKKLAKMNFTLHIDDFGTGYSSLANIGSMPFTQMKLDKSLIELIGEKRGEIILRHTIDLGKDIGMNVVAEGVENKTQVEFLKSTRCDLIQGFYFSKAVSADTFEDMLGHEVIDEEIIKMVKRMKRGKKANSEEVED